MQRCIQVYEQTHKTKFLWLECYEILEDLPKWNAQHEPGTQGDSSNAPAGALSGKRKNRSRSTGKRQKALSDKIDRMLERDNTSTSNGEGGGDRLSMLEVP
jgi:hypothetical protein